MPAGYVQKNGAENQRRKTDGRTTVVKRWWFGKNEPGGWVSLDKRFLLAMAQESERSLATWRRLR